MPVNESAEVTAGLRGFSRQMCLPRRRVLDADAVGGVLGQPARWSQPAIAAHSASGVGRPSTISSRARAQSVAAGYVTGGLAMLLALPPLLVLRRIGGRADIIVGRKAGKQGPCAAQGLPQVASVDTAARQPAPTG